MQDDNKTKFAMIQRSPPTTLDFEDIWKLLGDYMSEYVPQAGDVMGSGKLLEGYADVIEVEFLLLEGKYHSKNWNRILHYQWSRRSSDSRGQLIREGGVSDFMEVEE